MYLPLSKGEAVGILSAIEVFETTFLGTESVGSGLIAGPRNK